MREWAEIEGVSVNALVASMLEKFFKQLRKSRALLDEFRQGNSLIEFYAGG